MLVSDVYGKKLEVNIDKSKAVESHKKSMAGHGYWIVSDEYLLPIKVTKEEYERIRDIIIDRWEERRRLRA